MHMASDDHIVHIHESEVMITLIAHLHAGMLPGPAPRGAIRGGGTSDVVTMSCTHVSNG